jgi:hypothetical protein
MNFSDLQPAAASKSDALLRTKAAGRFPGKGAGIHIANPPAELKGGSILGVGVHVGKEQYVDLEQKAAALLAVTDETCTSRLPPPRDFTGDAKGK